MAIHIRPEQTTDIDRITEVTRLAFQNAAHTCCQEHRLIGALRQAGALTLSLVAVSDRGIVGHVAVSPVTFQTAAAGGWFGLGPISVLPECQRQGIGTGLVRAALGQLRARNARGCILVGDPHFYTRFGFQADATLTIPEVPPEVTLSLRLIPGTDQGMVHFHPAFLAALAAGPDPAVNPPRAD